MTTRDLSGEDIYRVLVNSGGFEHVRTAGDHLILRWDPPDEHENQALLPFHSTIRSVSARYSISIGTLHDIADSAGAEDFDAFCEWIHRNR